MPSQMPLTRSPHTLDSNFSLQYARSLPIQPRVLHNTLIPSITSSHLYHSTFAGVRYSLAKPSFYSSHELASPNVSMPARLHPPTNKSSHRRRIDLCQMSSFYLEVFCHNKHAEEL